MYQKVDTNLNFVDREKKVEEFWKENHIFETPHRPCTDPCNQGHDPQIPYNEGLHGSA